MKKQLLTCLLLSPCFSSEAQITFQKDFGGTAYDFGYCVQQTMDGGYIITGNTNGFGAGNADVYLIKTDANGNSLWTKTYGSGGNDFGYSVQQTSDGGYIIAGSFSAGFAHVYLIRTDANGDTLWTKTFGGTGDDIGTSVQQTTDGGYIITGWTNSFGAGNSDVYLIKTDTNGDSLWTKTFGGANYDGGWCVQQTTDGGYVVIGYTQSFGAGAADVYLIRTDANGNLLWSKTFGGTGYDWGFSVQQTTDGGYIFGGNTYSFGAGNSDVYLIKTNTYGDSLWSKTFGGIDDDRAYSIQQTTDSGYIISGLTYNFGAGYVDVYLIKTDADGDSLWTKTFGGINYEEGRSVQQTSDGGYVIAGSTSSFNALITDIYLIRTDGFGSSGCNEGSTGTIISIPSTQVTSPITIVSSGGMVSSPPTIVGSGGTVNTLCTTIGIEELTTDNSFFISPNPSTGNFIISFDGAIMKGTVEILNIPGERIFTENIFNESKKEINVKNISQGIYFVTVFDGERYYCRKIIIK